MEKILKVIIIFIFCMSIFIGCQKESGSEKNIVEQSALHPAYTVETIVEASTLIVHGKVLNQGESFIYSAETNTGDTIDLVFTPMTIEVMDCLKGSAGETIVYNQRGGETETAIYQVDDGGEVEVGEEVVLFLNEVNVTWGEQGVYRIQDGNTMIENRMLPIAFYSDSSQNRYSEISFDDLKSLVLDYVNE